MFHTDDTIVAIATPLGRAGLGIVRLSGPDAERIARALIGRSAPLVPRYATFAHLQTPSSVLDRGESRTDRHRPESRGERGSAEARSERDRSECRGNRDRTEGRRERDRTEGRGVSPGRAIEADPGVGAVEGAVPGERERVEEGRELSAVAEPGPRLATDVRDHVVVTCFPHPHSYTGDDVVEISAHGSPVVLQGIVQAAMALGARLAEPGEFTLRAFLHGKLDLVQAEAVADLIEAVTPRQARAAFDQLEGTLTGRIHEIEAALFDLIARLEASLDFPDEGYHFVAQNAAGVEIGILRARIAALLRDAARGRMIREGAQVAILGTPNVGKSSLFNALLNANRAIVTPIPGTTRDLLTERVDVRGISVSLVDTAGIRVAADAVEEEGIARARQAAAVADLTLVVLDRSRSLDDDDRALVEVAAARTGLVVVNKIDLPPAWDVQTVAPDAVTVSVKTGDGLDALLDRMAETLGAAAADRDEPIVSNVRHADLLARAAAALSRAAAALASTPPVSEEFVLADLQEAAAALQEITGRRTTDDLLAHIFARFCIGK